MPALRKVWAVVPAAGVGARMQTDKPKQYLSVRGRALIDITLEKLLAHPAVEGAVVALADGDPYWQRTAFARDSRVVPVMGGETRAHSVRAALQRCLASQPNPQALWALVHDAARPCVHPAKISELIEAAYHSTVDGAILAVPCADTVKRVHDQHIETTEDRGSLWLAHTPQCFPAIKLHDAINAALAKQKPITDEASAIEVAGGRVQVVTDRRDNIKVTVPEDLAWADTILHQQGVI